VLPVRDTQAWQAAGAGGSPRPARQLRMGGTAAGARARLADAGCRAVHYARARQLLLDCQYSGGHLRRAPGTRLRGRGRRAQLFRRPHASRPHNCIALSRGGCICKEGMHAPLAAIAFSVWTPALCQTGAVGSALQQAAMQAAHTQQPYTWSRHLGSPAQVLAYCTAEQLQVYTSLWGLARPAGSRAHPNRTR